MEGLLSTGPTPSSFQLSKYNYVVLVTLSASPWGLTFPLLVLLAVYQNLQPNLNLLLFTALSTAHISCNTYDTFFGSLKAMRVQKRCVKQH